MSRVFRVLLALWAGSLWSTVWVATLVFHALSDRHQAGVIAGRLFAIEAYIGVGVAALALAMPARARFVWGYLAAALLAVSQWGLVPVMDAAHRRGAVAGLTFGAWHGVAALVYGLACLTVLRVVWNEEFR